MHNKLDLVNILAMNCILCTRNKVSDQVDGSGSCEDRLVQYEI